MDKSDVCLMTGTMLITVSLIMWETFGLMITPTVLTVAAGCFVATVLCAAREEELRSRKRKRR